MAVGFCLMEPETSILPEKVRTYTSAGELLAKLEGKAALWERTARDASERSLAFEEAAQLIREGETSVTIGRTTYTLAVEGE